MSDYSYWQNALSGTFGEIHDGDAQPGFYRKRTGKGAGYIPVAVWEQDGKIIAVCDGREADSAELWSYVADKPIQEQQYHDRVRTGRWWDEDEAVTASLAPPPVGHNNPPTDPAAILQEQIESALKGVDEYAQVNDDIAAAKAQSLRSRLLELSGDADKKRESLVRPHLDAQRDINGVWQPLVKSAKAGADAIRAAISAHETRQLRKAEQAARDAAETKRKADLETAKLAAEAEAAGKPAPAPEPPPPPPEPTPAPATTVRGAYGRAASKKMVAVAKVVDQDKAYMAMRTHKELVELIATLAQRAATAGIPIDGVEVTEEVKIT